MIALQCEFPDQGGGLYCATYPCLGEIRLNASNFAPSGWALCQGQLLPISQHTALFSLLGTAYGGDGVSSFALPDLRGRAPIGTGQGPNLGNRVVGQKLGGENRDTRRRSAAPDGGGLLRGPDARGRGHAVWSSLRGALPERVNLRKGYRTRDWDTRMGTVELAIRSCARAATFPAG